MSVGIYVLLCVYIHINNTHTYIYISGLSEVPIMSEKKPKCCNCANEKIITVFINF